VRGNQWIGGLVLAVGAAGFTAGWFLRGGTADAQTTDTPGLQPAQQQMDPMLDARTKGAPDAPITVYEVSDFQCPYCRVFWEETLPALDREYIQTGKVRFVFLNLPLPSIHPNAAAAHEFAMCAASQDRFWEAHDLLYEHQASWGGLPEPGEFFRTLADSAGLDRQRLEECFDTGAVRALIEQEVQLNIRSGIQSTPSFVIEDQLLPGAAPIDVWRPILDSIFVVKTGG
jgi:protein-disulfide isomerase